MSGHADTIRRALEDFDLEVPQGRDATLSTDALAALDALLVEQADRIAWLEGEVAGWRIKLAECAARNHEIWHDADCDCSICEDAHDPADALIEEGR